MKVRVSIADISRIALLDSESSHNFIDIALAQRAGVRLQPCPHLTVTVANGDRVASLGKAPAQNVSVDGEAFGVDLYALPLGEYDMVLGVQWLGTLGPILWDFTTHTMCFTRAGRSITWRGLDTTPGLSSATFMSHDGDLLDALLEEFDSLFAEP